MKITTAELDRLIDDLTVGDHQYELKRRLYGLARLGLLMEEHSDTIGYCLDFTRMEQSWPKGGDPLLTSIEILLAMRPKEKL